MLFELTLSSSLLWLSSLENQPHLPAAQGATDEAASAPTAKQWLSPLVEKYWGPDGPNHQPSKAKLWLRPIVEKWEKEELALAELPGTTAFARNLAATRRLMAKVLAKREADMSKSQTAAKAE
jgi:hypothetical protein